MLIETARDVYHCNVGAAPAEKPAVSEPKPAVQPSNGMPPVPPLSDDEYTELKNDENYNIFSYFCAFCFSIRIVS